MYTLSLPLLVIVAPNLLVIFIPDRVKLGLEEVFKYLSLSDWWVSPQPMGLGVAFPPSLCMAFWVESGKIDLILLSYIMHTKIDFKLLQPMIQLKCVYLTFVGLDLDLHFHFKQVLRRLVTGVPFCKFRFFLLFPRLLMRFWFLMRFGLLGDSIFIKSGHE